MASLDDNEYIQVQTTLETKEDADTIAKVILEKRLAACVHIIGPISSSYWWEGKLESATEYVLLAKTKAGMYQALEDTIRENHGYQVPEIIATPVIGGLDRYLEWIGKEVGMSGNGGSCPKCGMLGCAVVDSRKVDLYENKNVIRRRRECLHCDIRFNTYEVSEDTIKHYQMLKRMNFNVDAANRTITKKARVLSFFMNDLKRFLKEFEEAATQV